MPAEAGKNAHGNLTVVSFLYGRPFAEGICTKRLVDALRLSGCAVNVIGCSLGTQERHEEAQYLASISMKYLQPQRWLGGIAGIPVANWDWVLRTRGIRPRSDIIYARYYPLSSLAAGKNMAERANLPLAIHFSDPFPNPWEEAARRSRRARFVRELLERAVLVTFTTEEARQYMQEIHSCDLQDKSHLVRNIVPDWQVEIPVRERREWVVTYVGNFYPPRTPDALVHGLRQANRIGGGRTFSLRLVGTDAVTARYCGRLAGIELSVIALPHSEQVGREYAHSDISIVMDSEVGRPVFLATKAGEALQSAPRVLFITPGGSPARSLFDREFQSVVFSKHDAPLVAESLLRLVTVDRQTVFEELPLRRALLAEFRPGAVADALLRRLAAISGAGEFRMCVARSENR